MHHFWRVIQLERVEKLGADGVQIASRFVVTEECDASDAYNGWGLELDKVGGSLPKQCRNTAVESAVEVPYADDTSGVYKISMVRMSTTD